MPLPDYYSILEVPATATLEQIKQAYRRLVRRYHPDLNKETRDTQIKRLNEAYEILSDAAKRAAYDALLLEELRHAALQRTLRHQREALQRRTEPSPATPAKPREPKMTWAEGFAGFVRELKKGIRDE
ncbi:MAG: DnaJ domain-containing protein [Ktedonobacteraceae bacterium]|nr:DnaJ domain-containing protein [Ktedonobacteraceae bacterium]